MRLSIPPPPPCTECGSEPIYHSFTYASLCIELGLARIMSVPLKAGQAAVRRLKPRRTHTRGFFDRLERMGLGTFLDEHDGKTMLLAQMLWQEAKSRSIWMREFRPLGSPLNTFTAAFPDGRRITFEGIPHPASVQWPAWWIDNKAVMKMKLRKLGIPVAHGGSAFMQGQALRIFRKLEKPVIVKPAEGSASRHTATHITTEEELRRAFKAAKQVSPLVIVEEELRGAVYRPTLVQGSLIATLRRDQPQVAGDGTHTIQELIEAENGHPARQGPYFSKIPVTPYVHAELLRQGHALDTILPQGATAFLHQKVNWGIGGTTTDVTELVHPDNVELFERVAKAAHAPVIGIDFIIGDIARSWKEQERCGVIETNGMPFFDNHHLPFSGKPRNVAGAIWDFVDANLK